MYLTIVGLRQRMNRLIPVVLILTHKVSRFDDKCFIIPFGLTVRLKVINCRCQFFEAEVIGDGGDELTNELCSVFAQQKAGVPLQ